ncbi:MAG: hypothetical protein Q8S44_06900 [Flavobacteriaceae bacterium]|nr:hypothetical protein [Flavobacteriaceae bacterium]
MKKNTLLLVFTFLLFINCSESSDTDTIDEVVSISYELLEFEFTPQIGTQEDRLKYKVKFINNSNSNVQGFPKITLNSDGIEYSEVITENIQCSSIPAKSFCIYSFDKTDNNPQISAINVKFIKAEYLIRN